MTGVKEQLVTDLKDAMRGGDTVTRDAIRLLQAAIQQDEIDGGHVLGNDAVLSVLQRQAKQRRESIAEYTKANRADLAAVEQQELEIIEKYLPTQMSREDIADVAAAAIAQMGVTDMRGMGPLMGRLMGQLHGKADGRLVNEVVRELLTRS
jgi:uncharacterized protein YqeY